MRSRSRYGLELIDITIARSKAAERRMRQEKTALVRRSGLWRRSVRRCLLIIPDSGTPPARVGGVLGLFARAGVATAAEAAITPADIARRECEAVVTGTIVSALPAPSVVVSPVITHGFGALGFGALKSERRTIMSWSWSCSVPYLTKAANHTLPDRQRCNRSGRGPFRFFAHDDVCARVGTAD